MIKAFLILAAVLGVVAFVSVVATATPNDKHEYEAYIKWKERKRKQ